GTLAIQLARLKGDEVTAAIRNDAHEALVKRLGASHAAIGEDLAGADAFGPYNLVLESVGGGTLARALGLLAPGGTCVLFGAAAHGLCRAVLCDPDRARHRARRSLVLCRARDRHRVRSTGRPARRSHHHALGPAPAVAGRGDAADAGRGLCLLQSARRRERG